MFGTKKQAMRRTKISTNFDRTWHCLLDAIDAPPQCPKRTFSRWIDASNVRDQIYSADDLIESAPSVQNIGVVIKLCSF